MAAAVEILINLPVAWVGDAAAMQLKTEDKEEPSERRKILFSKRGHQGAAFNPERKVEHEKEAFISKITNSLSLPQC